MATLRKLALAGAAAALLLSVAFGRATSPITDRQVEPDSAVSVDPENTVEPDSDTSVDFERTTCEISDRFLDGGCTNPSNPSYGSAGRPVFSYLDNHTSAVPTGQDRPSARVVSNVLSDQSENVDIRNERFVNELWVFFGQFVDHNLVLSIAGDEDMPIPIPDDDPVFPDQPGGVFRFTRSERGPVAEGSDNVRPLNDVSQILDLSAVYGSDEERGAQIRTGTEGRMRISEGNLLPLNEFGLENPPDRDSNEFFLAGDTRANEHPMLTVMHTIWVREHNNIIDELLQDQLFRLLSDDGLFQLARRINIAQFQAVVYEEFFPAIVGSALPEYTGFKSDVDPTVSDIFSTAGFRVGHTMVGNGVPRAGPENVPIVPLPIEEMFFRMVEVIQEQGIEVFLRGAIVTVAQEVDHLVVDALRNFLFEAVPEEVGLDLISLNIQRGRDHAIPTYNEIREICNFPRRASFEEITSNVQLQAAFASIYNSVDDVDAWIGLVSEDHEPGSSFGETMIAVWTKEFTRLRDGDQFFYLRDGEISTLVRQRMPRVMALFEDGGSVFRDIILRNTDLTEAEVDIPDVFIQRA